MKHTVEEIRLKNGARGLLIDVPDATVMSFQVQFRAGNRYVLNKDITKRLTLWSIWRLARMKSFVRSIIMNRSLPRTALITTLTLPTIQWFYEAICADFEWDRILELQRLAITTPRFNADELEAEKGNVRSELTGYLNNHNRVMWPRIQQALGEDILTYNQRLKTIANIELKDIKNHHKRTHTLRNMRFVVAGKMAGRKAAIKEHLEGWQIRDGRAIRYSAR